MLQRMREPAVQSAIGHDAIANVKLAAQGSLTLPSTCINTRPAIGFTDATAATSFNVNGVTVSIPASARRAAAAAT